MKGFIGLTKRNLMVYFKNIQSIFFSMMTPIIVLALYLLFLKSTFVGALDDACAGLAGLITADDVNMLSNGMLLSGILGSAMITIPYTTLSTIVYDRDRRIDYDISATPISRVQIILSYFTASALSAFLMTAAVAGAGLVILLLQGRLYLTAAEIFGLLGTVLLGSISATSLFMIFMLFLRTPSASNSFFGILAAASGFVIGAYIPVSEFSGTVQTICNLFPGSHITALCRNLLMNRLLEHIDGCIGGLDNGLFVGSVKESFVFSPRMFGENVSCRGMVGYVLAIAALSIAAISFLYPRVYKRK